MPNILINELDNTTYLNREITNENTVVIFDTSGTDLGQAVMCRNLRTFYDNFGKSAATASDIITNADGSKSYSSTIALKALVWEYAANIIRVGFPVLYIKTNNVRSWMKLLEDKIYYNIKFIPTIVDPTKLVNITVTDFIVLAESRGDCEVIVDFDKYKDGTQITGIDPSNATTYIGKRAASIKSSYAVVPYPGATFTSYLTGVTLRMPPSFWVIKTIAEGVGTGTPLYSTWAGSKRGAITGVVDWDERVSTQLMESWTTAESIVPLMNIPPYGDVIYGNNTRCHPGTYTTGTKVTDDTPTPINDGEWIEFKLLGAPISDDSLKFDVSITYDIYNIDPSTGTRTKQEPQIKVDTKCHSVGTSIKCDDTPSAEVGQLVNSLGVVRVDCGMILSCCGSTELTQNQAIEVTAVELSNVEYVDSDGINAVAPTIKSALDSLNVRLTANEIKKEIYNICLGLTFDSNDYALWNEFKVALSYKLNAMRESRAINDYLILMNDEIVTEAARDQLTVPGIVKVDITRAAERFDINFELTPTGAIMSENLV